MNFRLNATQLIVEIRIRPNLAYYDDLFKIAASLEGDYEDWGAQNNPSSVTMVNNKKKTLLSVSSDRLAVMTQNPDELENLKVEAHRLFTLFLDPTDISEVRRLGVRRVQVFDAQGDYQELAEKFHGAFYSSDESLKSLGADSIDDVAYIIEAIKDGAKTRIRVGPLKKEQLDMYFHNQFKQPVKLTKESNLVIDVDVYNETTTSLEASENTLDNLFETNKTISDGHVEYCKEKM